MVDLGNLINNPASKQQPQQPQQPQQVNTPNSLLKLRNAYQQANIQPTDTVLVYGPPKAGKTAFVGSIASMEEFDTVYFFDVEGSSTTLLNPEIALSEKALSKIKLIPISDTKATSASIEAMLKYFSTRAKDSVTLCQKHCKIECSQCKSHPETLTTLPAVHTLTEKDCIVIDTISQVGVSAGWAGEELARREEIKTGKANAFAKYAKQGELLLDLLTMIQAVRNVTIICTAHNYILDEEERTRPTITVPAIGTQNFSRNVGKFFSTVVYMEVANKQFKSGSSPTYRLNTLAGSRLGTKVEKVKDRPPVMSDLLRLEDN